MMMIITIIIIIKMIIIIKIMAIITKKVKIFLTINLHPLKTTRVLQKLRCQS